MKDNLALDFLVQVFVTWKQEKGVNNVTSSLKKSGLESKYVNDIKQNSRMIFFLLIYVCSNRLMDFFPSNKRTPEHFNSFFQEKGLAEIVKLQKNQASQEARNNLQKLVSDSLEEGKSPKDLISEVKDYSNKNNLPENEIVTIVS